MNTMQINELIHFYCSYTSEYSEIYESTYDTSFVFVDQEDDPDQQISDLDSLVTPPSSSN